MASALKTVVKNTAPKLTPQSQKAAKGQKKNNAGGFTFTVGALDRIKRFLILGSEDSFYMSGAKLALQNATTIEKYTAAASLEATRELIDLIVSVSVEGRAAKQQPALFALALVIATTPHAEAKNYGYSKLSDVARTGTTLFEFAGFLGQFQRFGMGAQKAFARWYTEKSVPQVAYQMAKYQSREGFSHKDILRLSKRVKSGDNAQLAALLNWAVGKPFDVEMLPRVVQGMELAKTADAKKIPFLIREYGLTWEMVPSESLNDPFVWEALLDGNLPLGALIRNLPKLTRVGILKPLSKYNKLVADRLTDQEALVKARIHPLNVLIALKTYAGGVSLRGSESWTPVQQIVDALDKAFYLAFKAVEPAGKRTLIGVDVSGSMLSNIMGMPISSSEVAASLALVTANVEPETHIIGFDSSIRALGISPSTRLDDAMHKVYSRTFGSTDASAAIRYALDKGLSVETFIIITDNDTWAGRNGHPHEVLQQYRKATGIDAKLIVLATYASKFSIADPNDPGMLDLAGFDTVVPRLITEFSKGL